MLVELESQVYTNHPAVAEGPPDASEPSKGSSVKATRQENSDAAMILKAYELGRMFNELSWNVQLAYLGSCDFARDRANSLIEDLSIRVQPLLPHHVRTQMGAAFVDAGRCFENQFHLSERTEQLWQAADEMHRPVDAGAETLEESREATCRILLLPVVGTSPGLRNSTYDLLNTVAKSAFELGEAVDEGIRPSPAYRWMYDSSTLGHSALDVIYNQIPAPGTVKLPPTWRRQVEQRCSELAEATGGSFQLGSLPKWRTSNQRLLVKKVDAVLRRGIESVATSPPPVAADPISGSPAHLCPERSRNNLDGYVTLAQIVQVVDVGKPTLLKACKAGHVRSIKEGSKRYVHASDALLWKLDRNSKIPMESSPVGSICAGSRARAFT